MSTESVTLSITLAPNEVAAVDLMAYSMCFDKRDDVFNKAIEYMSWIVCPVDRYYMKQVRPFVAPITPKLSVKLSKRLYNVYKKTAILEGVPIEVLIFDLLKKYVGGIVDLAGIYLTSYGQTIESVSSELEKHNIRGDPDAYAREIGELVTTIIDKLGIPNTGDIIEVDKLDEDLRRTVIEKIRKLKKIRKAFGIDIAEYKGRVKSIYIEDTRKFTAFYGYGSKTWSEPLNCFKQEHEKEEITIEIDITKMLSGRRYEEIDYTLKSFYIAMNIIGKSLEDIVILALKRYEPIIVSIDSFISKYYMAGKMKPAPSKPVEMAIATYFQPDLYLRINENGMIPVTDTLKLVDTIISLAPGPLTLNVSIEKGYHRILEKLAILSTATGKKYDTISLLRDLLKPFAAVVSDRLGAHSLKVARIPILTEMRINAAVSRGQIKYYNPEDAALLLGKFATLTAVILGTVPFAPTTIDIDKVKEDTWAKVAKVLEEEFGEKTVDPRKYFTDLVEELKKIASAFDIEIIEEEGRIKTIKIKKPHLIRYYYGYGTITLKKPLEEQG